MNGCDLKKVNPNMPNLKVEKIKKILKLSAVLSALSRVHVPTILNFAPSPKRITFDSHVTAGYKQESLYPRGVTARTKGPKLRLRECVKARRMGNVVISAAESGEDWRSPRS